MTIDFYGISEWENIIMRGPETLQLLYDMLYPISVQKQSTNYHLKAVSAKHNTAFSIWLMFVVHIQAAVTSKLCWYSEKEVCKSGNKNLKKIICFINLF